MRLRHFVLSLGVVGCVSFIGWTVATAAEPFEQTARYILEVVKAFRAAYVLHVVEHTKDSGTVSREDWEKDAHFLPLPAQFVKQAASKVESFEIGLISLTPINPANRPRTAAETDALIQLEKDRQRGFISFVDGDKFKAVSADLAIVRSCIDCHNHHPNSPRRNFQQWDVMGALVVRLKQEAEQAGVNLPPEPPRSPFNTPDRPAAPTIVPPWVR